MSLIEKHCQPCEGNVAALQSADIIPLQAQIPLWTVTPDYKRISRRFDFKNYYKTIAFVNAIAWVAHQENHHPDLSVGYNQCTVIYQTHAIGGLSENDFICAAKIDNLNA